MGEHIPTPEQLTVRFYTSAQVNHGPPIQHITNTDGQRASIIETNLRGLVLWSFDKRRRQFRRPGLPGEAARALRVTVTATRCMLVPIRHRKIIIRQGGVLNKTISEMCREHSQWQRTCVFSASACPGRCLWHRHGLTEHNVVHNTVRNHGVSGADDAAQRRVQRSFRGVGHSATSTRVQDAWVCIAPEPTKFS